MQCVYGGELDDNPDSEMMTAYHDVRVVGAARPDGGGQLGGPRQWCLTAWGGVLHRRCIRHGYIGGSTE